MCGIVGICYGKDGPGVEEWTPSEMAQMMLPASVHRGPHAWGWMSYNGADVIDIFKAVGRSDTKKAIKSMEVDPAAHWWIGHVRYATHGDPKELWNDHPITHGNITGVHNGVIRNYQEILDITGRHPLNIDGKTIESEVDSEAIFAAVNKWGHQRGLNRVRGDMVACYVDHRYPETIRFARTQGRPLWLAHTPTGAMVFASEPDIITNTGIECSEPSQIMPYRLLTVKHGKITGRHNLIVPTSGTGTQHSRVSVSRVGTKGFDPFQVRGITDRLERERMAPPVQTDKDREDRLERNRELRQSRTGDPANWHRPHHNGATMPPPALPPGRPQTPPASPLNRKAAQLREQILERTRAETGQEPRLTRMRRTPSQAYKRQEDGTFNPEHGLYWQNGQMVDIDTYIENLLGNEQPEPPKEATA